MYEKAFNTSRQMFWFSSKINLQSAVLLKNKKIPIFEIAIPKNLSRIIPVPITPDCNIGLCRQTCK
jgi:hypothetical protein